MIRNLVKDAREYARDGFRWRGNEPTRIEGFSDAVFAFALTLLVVSLEVPKTFDDLTLAMRQFPAFGVCFMLLIWVWYEHYIYFRRYGAQDGVTILLNALLLFVVVFFVYPLKFLFAQTISAMLGVDTRVALASGQLIEPIGPGQWQPLMMIYGAGYASLFAVFAALYARVLRPHTTLDLSARERFLSRMNLLIHVSNVVIGLLVVTAAFVLKSYAGFAGFLFFLIMPVRLIVERIKHQRIQAMPLEEEQPSGGQ